jgi:beta-ureidopropionase / N-carbamoyl-L-amino-acid hydrolase
VSAACSSPIDAERLWLDLMTLGELTEPDRPFTRRAFSPAFVQGRAFLTKRLQEAGLTTRIDVAGNLIGRLDGLDPTAPVIALGSHSDTVPRGGRFDGVAGVIAALEVARALKERGRPLRSSVEVIDCLAEEPTDFGLSCVGSRGLCGKLDNQMLAMTNPAGERLEQALRGVGGDPNRLSEAVRNDIGAFLELHIEQGPVLEARGIDIGIVTSIVGIRRIEIVFEGQPAHAGTAPMELRRDAAVPAAATLVEVRRLADALADEGQGYFVATVGVVQVEPGGLNVVPERSRIVVDARCSDPRKTDRFTRHIDTYSAAVADEFRVARSRFSILSDGASSSLDYNLQRAFARAADRLRLSYMNMASGAGHDTAFLARICPAAMIFVPCLEGMSHTPDEWADKSAIAAGAAVLLEAVLEWDERSNLEPCFRCLTLPGDFSVPPGLP